MNKKKNMCQKILTFTVLTKKNLKKKAALHTKNFINLDY